MWVGWFHCWQSCSSGDLLEGLMELIQHADELLHILLSPLADSWTVGLPKDWTKALQGNAVKLSQPYVRHWTAKGGCRFAILLVQGCFTLSWQQILHEQWHAAEALQNCIHVAEVAHVSAQPVLTARKSHSTELAASLLLQHNTFLLGHRKHRIQALIIKSDLLRRNTVFSHEDSREDCTNWCQWEMAEVRLFIQTYGRAELRLWQRLENDKMQENKTQNAKQSLQQEICCSTAARAGRKLPAACHYLKWMLLFSVNSVFVQTQRRLPLTAHLLKGERQKFQSQKTNTAICLDIKASC